MVRSAYQVNSDDEETALRVTLLKSGSASDRAAAELGRFGRRRRCKVELRCAL